ncbi:MAG: adenylate/guanylate cyclase domain-containing protein [Novosphingobium sp.]
MARGWRNIRAAGPRRLVITGLLLVVALLLARFSWYLPVTGDAERALYDLRAFISAPRVDQDQRVQVVAYDDQTLIAVRKRSPLDRGLLAKALRQLDTMGAKAIGVDMLFDQPQDEDEELIATLRAMKTPVFVAYADIAGNRDDITWEQQQYLDSFMKRLEGSSAKPASIRLDYANGVARRWPEPLTGLPPLLGKAMLSAAKDEQAERFTGYTGAIRYRLPASDDRPVFSSLRIDLFADPEVAQALSSQVEGRYVLVGGEIVDLDRVETPFTPTTGESVPGIQVHAAMIGQMLDGARMPLLGSWQLWSMAVLVVLMATLTSLIESRFWRVFPLLAAQFLTIVGIPFAFAHLGGDTLGTPAVGWVVAWLLSYLAVSNAARASGAVERRFAQSALGRYLPRDIAQEIIDNPEKLTLSGSKQQLYILFSDLEGFTQLSHDLPPEKVAKLLNEYLDKLSAVVLEHGGVIDKYVGDAIVAFWGAPIARPDDGRRAALAGYALWQAGERFRKQSDPSLPPIGKTRVGLHYGEAVVGNFGGERRIQYTALGDAMNTASRLEAANKALGSSVMASREFAEKSQLKWWRPMGRVILRGRARAVDLYEPAPDFPAKDREALSAAVALIDTDSNAAAATIEQLIAEHPTDKALQNLLARTRNLGEGNAYDLG